MAVFFLSVFMFITVLATGEWPAFALENNKMKIEMKKLLPREVGIYKSDEKDQFFDRNTTFRYMDGAAELYRSFGFKLLIVRCYTKANHPPIIVELFDMGSSEDAFGVFSFETEGEEVGVGQGSDYGGGLLRFWKGKFFVNVYAEQETSSTKQVVLEIGKAIAKSIEREGRKPKLIDYLPEKGLQERSIRYFHLHQSLNYHYFLSHQNILRLMKETNAVLASYFSSEKEGKTFLFLTQYPTGKMAKEAFQSFIKAYMPDSSSSGVIQTENGRWTAVQSHKEFVIVVFDAPLKEKAEELIQATRRKL